MKSEPGVLQFVNISNPGESKGHRKQVRAHAARNSKARKERVSKHQVKKPESADRPGSFSSEGSPPALSDPGSSSASSDSSWDAWDSELSHTHMKLLKDIESPSSTYQIGTAKVDPFDSFVRPLFPFENRLFNHFIQHVMMSDLSTAPCWNLYKQEVWERHLQPRVDWLQAAASDYGMLCLIFLIACRNLNSRINSGELPPMALKYKYMCLRMLNHDIAMEQNAPSEATITKSLALASEELFFGNKKVADQHLQAAAHMVRLRGRPMKVHMWKHAENQHLWAHWEKIMAGWDTNAICELYRNRPGAEGFQRVPAGACCPEEPPADPVGNILKDYSDNHAFKPLLLNGVLKPKDFNELLATEDTAPAVAA